ncbi:glycoside hydrolase family 71 protein [Neolentinus lepideus HHB14362 ss-1]|uniref:Glycoside hydrolase family 71 protein n=1 Tax=Neolentinus lepideus HHB14362 ss-1 TaxID=1314782 RepID=A0A165NZ63_9AGAM|nr:glycoside hydrolase family 71 protein [Neolentinus lepideus HHB14362 ss-1]
MHLVENPYICDWSPVGLYSCACALHINRRAATVSSVVKKRQSNSKYVVAHHIVGNTYPYTVDDWANDIALASGHGIDAFALNVGNESFEYDRVADAYTAAQNSGAGFKLFFSFDMSSLACSTPQDAAYLVGNVTKYASHPNQFKYDNLVFVSTFSGETCTFGQGSVSQGWQTQFIDNLSGANAVYFVPSFFVDPTTFSTYNSVMNGAFNWNSGWPISLTTDVANQQLSAAGTSLDNLDSNGETILQSYICATDTDKSYISGISAMSQTATNRAYMAAVSPWFFTHYGPDTYNKNWIYLADWHLYPRRWQNLVSLRTSVDIVEIITWNDYGESHYLGPIEGAQPNSQSWVDGFDHQGWLDMTPYFSAAFKTGSYPAITQDKIYLWARPHPRNATASADSVGPPTSYQLADQLWAVVMTTADSTVTLSTSSTNSKNFSVNAGLSLLNMPLTPGGSMSGVISRNNQSIVSLSPSGYTFNPNPTTYNYNAFVAYSH